MTPRLLAELQRLFLPLESPGPGAASPGPAAWADASGRVRVFGLALASDVGWSPLAMLWQGVQADLGLPAPAIAVNGHDALQLWFALAQPVTVDDALAALAGLRQRFLAEVPAHRIGQWPAARPGQADTAAGPRIDQLPPRQIGAERWSAFVSPDLAPVFADTPWLEIPPGDDAQASLLARLQPASAGAWHEARQRLLPTTPALQAPREAADGPAAPARPAVPDTRGQPAAGDDPDRAAARHFLRTVMDDAAAPLALRIEAARALLYAGTARR